jgi:hypothetical protein
MIKCASNNKRYERLAYLGVAIFLADWMLETSWSWALWKEAERVS